MKRLILVCGPIGAGKTSYSISFAKKIEAIRFSIDPWMQTLFSKDMTTLNYSWIMERVHRCQEQIWEVSEQILTIDKSVVLDLGFTSKTQRKVFADRAKALGINAELHYLNAKKNIRKQRINKRNSEKDPAVYSFELTDMMFDFMELKFEVPSQEEFEHILSVNT